MYYCLPHHEAKAAIGIFSMVGEAVNFIFLARKEKKGRKGGKRKGKKRRKGEERVKIANKSTEIDPNVADSSGDQAACISTGHTLGTYGRYCRYNTCIDL